MKTLTWRCLKFFSQLCTRNLSALPNHIILCPGQGSQYVGMLQNFNHSSEAIRKIIKTSNKVFGYSILDLCHHGPLEKLTR